MNHNLSDIQRTEADVDALARRASDGRSADPFLSDLGAWARAVDETAATAQRREVEAIAGLRHPESMSVADVPVVAPVRPGAYARRPRAAWGPRRFVLTASAGVAASVLALSGVAAAMGGNPFTLSFTPASSATTATDASTDVAPARATANAPLPTSASSNQALDDPRDEQPGRQTPDEVQTWGVVKKSPSASSTSTASARQQRAEGSEGATLVAEPRSSSSEPPREIRTKGGVPLSPWNTGAETSKRPTTLRPSGSNLTGSKTSSAPTSVPTSGPTSSAKPSTADWPGSPSTTSGPTSSSSTATGPATPANPSRPAPSPRPVTSFLPTDLIPSTSTYSNEATPEGAAPGDSTLGESTPGESTPELSTTGSSSTSTESGAAISSSGAQSGTSSASQ